VTGTLWPYPTPDDDGGADHLHSGQELPSMTLPATPNGEIDFSRRPGYSILFIYPWTGHPGQPNPPGWDDIPGAHGSTPEAEGFRDLHDAFSTLGAAVTGLSTQLPEHQLEFANRIGLPFPLASDADFKFQKAMALPTFQTGGIRYLKRLTLVIEDGAIVHKFYPVHPPGAHAESVLSWLQDHKRTGEKR
jgi:peroxiredoxin